MLVVAAVVRTRFNMVLVLEAPAVLVAAVLVLRVL
jgi:hypothetical protein